MMMMMLRADEYKENGEYLQVKDEVVKAFVLYAVVKPNWKPNNKHHNNNYMALSATDAHLFSVPYLKKSRTPMIFWHNFTKTILISVKLGILAIESL